MIKKELHKFGVSFENDFFKVFFTNNKSINFLNSCKKELIFTHQVHKKNIFDAANINVEHPLTLNTEADGIKVFANSNIAAGIQTADCVPCFVISRDMLFSLHLGWRSLAQGLLDEALSSFSKKEELFLFIGPHIQKKYFECGLEVLDIFKDKHKGFSNWFELKNNKAYIDLSKIIEQKVLAYNIKIFNTNIDTLSSNDHFSYRRAQKMNVLTKDRNVSIAYFK